MYTAKSESAPKSFNTRVIVAKQQDLLFSITIVRVCIPLFLASELFVFFAFSYYLSVFRECNGCARWCDVVEWKRPLNLIIPLLHR